MQKSTIIIGACSAGLSAGCYGQMNIPGTLSSEWRHGTVACSELLCS